jgi:PPP family 3-phenylpropionic acid transporter
MVNIIQSRGGDSTQLGLALFCMAAMELPTAIVYWRLQRRWGAERLLWISFLFCAVKALACLLASSVAGVYAAQLFQALSYGLFTPASVYFVNELMPSGDRVRGQTLMMVFTNGGGIMVGSMVCGWAIDFSGVNFMLALCTVSALVGFALMTVARRLPKERQPR